MKRLLHICLYFFVFFYLLFPHSLFAQQTSNTVRTRVGNPPATTAPPVDPATLPDEIQKKFGITMIGYDAEHLQWAWEKLWDVADTNFPELVKGAKLSAAACPDGSGFSCQAGCFEGEVSVYLKPYIPANNFKFLFTHELGHIIQRCTLPREKIKWADHEKALTQEGGISEYGRNPARCSGSSNPSEDYADMIAYYLNPTLGDVPPYCFGTLDSPAANPYYGTHGKFPLHEKVVKDILGEYIPL